MLPLVAVVTNTNTAHLFQEDDVFKAVPTPLSPPPASTPVTPTTPATPASLASPGTPCTPNSISPSGIVKRKTGQYVCFVAVSLLVIHFFSRLTLTLSHSIFFPPKVSTFLNFATNWGLIVFLPRAVLCDYFVSWGIIAQNTNYFPLRGKQDIYNKLHA